GGLTSVFCFQAEDGIRAVHVTGVQTCALPILFLELRNFINAYSHFSILSRSLSMISLIFFSSHFSPRKIPGPNTLAQWAASPIPQKKAVKKFEISNPFSRSSLKFVLTDIMAIFTKR